MLCDTINLVSIVVTSVSIGVAFYPRLRTRLRARASKAIFPIQEPRKLVVVCPSQPGADASANVATTHEDALALAAIQSYCVEHGIEHSVKLHSQLTAAERAQDLFLICGPGGNSVSADLLKVPSLGISYRFSKDPNGWSIAGDPDAAKYEDSGNTNYDHGIVARLHNPWSRSELPTFVYLAAGIRGLGTWGASYLLTNRAPDLAQQLQAVGSFGPGTEFSAIVEVQDQSPFPPKVTLVKPILR